ncbi:SMI1/KNR4 family protein [Mesorhizobium sp. DCY119]|uniref:SMI1/KNR4 family protein n=1 Tax=Mesorhizobium sp. DCY119 TaxID=2108445 RepID=UPI000E7301A9|nr:SMI1/KNR4 family protein [Mesorhizobium sp. DCY119]RJG40627.1 SMI1/KNR4 family protein [Mesorhizobium sp. DCY119]
MSIEDCEKAIGLLKDRSIDIFSGTGATDADIVAIEARLGVRLPPSYKAMLTQFGTLSFEGIEVYGWTRSGLDGKSIPNVVFATEDDRKRGLISDQMVNFMVAGYGPTFVLDCAEISADGEAPVYEISAGGIKRDRDRLADTFGAFFL